MSETKQLPESIQRAAGGELVASPCSADFAAWLHDYFRVMRFDSKHHLGLGDIRLTLGQQDDLVVAAERAHVGKPNDPLTIHP
ncbi:MAG: hypothetical protein O3A92_16860 [Verrucomicrobia bacterium]|nr:hypothetical protein [Verrucomicrobiota bacterium]